MESAGYDAELEGRLAALENLNKHSNGFFGAMLGKKTHLIQFEDSNGMSLPFRHTFYSFYSFSQIEITSDRTVPSHVK